MRRLIVPTVLFSAAAPASAQHGHGGGHAGGGVHHVAPAVHHATPAMHHPAPAVHHPTHTSNYHPSGGFHIYQNPALGYRPGYGVGGLGVGGLPYTAGYRPGVGLGVGGNYGSGLGGGFLSGGYSPYYVLPPVGGTAAAPAPLIPFADPASSTATAVSGQLPASLTVQFPAAAQVWLDGVVVPGDPDTDYTFTSRALRPGETATFRVRGRWQADGRTYEAVREVPLAPGARTRLLIVSGTEVQ